MARWVDQRQDAPKCPKLFRRRAAERKGCRETPPVHVREQAGLRKPVPDEKRAVRRGAGRERDLRGVHKESRRSRPAGKSRQDRKSTRLNSSHGYISYAVFCLKKKKAINMSRYLK